MEGKKFGSVYDPRYTGVVSFSRPAHPGGAEVFAEYLKKAAADPAAAKFVERILQNKSCRDIVLLTLL